MIKPSYITDESYSTQEILTTLFLLLPGLMMVVLARKGDAASKVTYYICDWDVPVVEMLHFCTLVDVFSFPDRSTSGSSGGSPPGSRRASIGALVGASSGQAHSQQAGGFSHQFCASRRSAFTAALGVGMCEHIDVGDCARHGPAAHRGRRSLRVCAPFCAAEHLRQHESGTLQFKLGHGIIDVGQQALCRRGRSVHRRVRRQGNAHQGGLGADIANRAWKVGYIKMRYNVLVSVGEWGETQWY